MFKSPDLKSFGSEPAVLLRDVARPNREFTGKFVSAKQTPAYKFAAIAAALLAAGCQTGKPATPDQAPVAATAVPTLQRVNANAFDCWIKSGDPAFKPYALLPELDTQYGRPRILVVDKKNRLGLPKLVIEAGGRPARISTYGPLAGEPIATRINGDVARWAAGNKGCGVQS